MELQTKRLGAFDVSAKADMRTLRMGGILRCTKYLLHTCHVSDGDRRSFHLLHLGVNADLVLAAGREVIEALSGSTTSQAHFLSLTVCKQTTTTQLIQHAIPGRLNAPNTLTKKVK